MSGLSSAAQNVPAATLISLRRPLIIAAVVGVLGLGASFIFKHPQMGVLFLVGLGMGLFNARLMQSKTLKIIEGNNPTKRAVTGSSMGRLAVLTVIALALAYFVKPDGLGIFIGLAVFQFIFMANTMIPVMKEYRRQ